MIPIHYKLVLTIAWCISSQYSLKRSRPERKRVCRQSILGPLTKVIRIRVVLVLAIFNKFNLDLYKNIVTY